AETGGAEAGAAESRKHDPPDDAHRPALVVDLDDHGVAHPTMSPLQGLAAERDLVRAIRGTTVEQGREDGRAAQLVDSEGGPVPARVPSGRPPPPAPGARYPRGRWRCAKPARPRRAPARPARPAATWRRAMPAKPTAPTERRRWRRTRRRGWRC